MFPYSVAVSTSHQVPRQQTERPAGREGKIVGCELPLGFSWRHSQCFNQPIKDLIVWSRHKSAARKKESDAEFTVRI